MLLTGRPTRSLHDFLASKMNEKALNKWETSTAAALEKLKDVGFMSVQTAMERVVLGLEELLGWSKWSVLISKVCAPRRLTPSTPLA